MDRNLICVETLYVLRALGWEERGSFMGILMLWGLECNWHNLLGGLFGNMNPKPFKTFII